nr:MAG TPA: hypothetical protein [Caudoviricetes sp.]
MTSVFGQRERQELDLHSNLGGDSVCKINRCRFPLNYAHILPVSI